MATSFNIKDQINRIDDLYLRTRLYILKDTVGFSRGNQCSARNNFGANLWTSTPNVNFGTEFHWNVIHRFYFRKGIQKSFGRILFSQDVSFGKLS